MTFAPEIATFAPPPPPLRRDAMITPSPPWRRSPTVSDRSPPQANIASALGASLGEEASVLRPVSLRQRGPTLSILGGRRKDSDPSRPTELLNGTNDKTSHRRSGSSKDFSRRSILRNTIPETASRPENTPDWGASLGLRKSSDKAAVNEISTKVSGEPEAALGKRGSVRKRLSMLRIGGGGAKKGGNMSSLDEE